MQTSDRRFLLGIFLLFSVIFGGVGGILWLVKKASQADAEAALKAEVKALAGALASEGPAWVQVRLDFASPTARLSCHGKECFWKARETQRQETRSVTKNGKTETRTVTLVSRSAAQVVPMKMTAGAAEFCVENWSAIKIGDELLLGRNERAAEAEPSDPGKPVPSANPNDRDLYLAPRDGVWVLAHFSGGRPGPFLGDSFFLSGKGREEFAEGLQSESMVLMMLAVIFGGLGLVFSGISVFILVKT